jgi:hypothetical protein
MRKAPRDCLRVDTKGNLYETGPGGVWIISPEGKHLGTIRALEQLANIGFGDADKNTLYIAARTSIYNQSRIAREVLWTRASRIVAHYEGHDRRSQSSAYGPTCRADAAPACRRSRQGGATGSALVS